MFEYIDNKTTRQELKSFCEAIILKAQKSLRDRFTFSFKLIGSGEARLMMVNGKDNSVDLDYNFIIQRDKKDLVKEPAKVKRLFREALKEACGPNSKVLDSTQVITCRVGRVSGYDFSFDVAIFIEANDGYSYKLICDKGDGCPRYIWNKVHDSRGFEQKFAELKRAGRFEDIKRKYRDKKNRNLQRGSEKASFSLLLEAVNELWREALKQK